MTQGFGIDFGGSGIKGAPVDLEQGQFTSDRVRIKTPSPATPEAVAEVFEELVDRFPEQPEAVGVTVPGVVRNGVVHSAANIDKSWIDTDADALFTKALDLEVHVVNDADAAGLAEVRYGAAAGHHGLVMLTTLGTGIGSALLMDGRLVPNSKLGHLEIDGGRNAERWAASSVKEKEGLDWEEWATRLTVYYQTLEKLFSPEPSSSAAGSASRPTSSSPSSTSAPRWCRPSCATRQGSSAPRCGRRRATRDPPGCPAHPRRTVPRPAGLPVRPALRRPPPDGLRMHHVDEGPARLPVLMLHGEPWWSVSLPAHGPGLRRRRPARARAGPHRVRTARQADREESDSPTSGSCLGGWRGWTPWTCGASRSSARTGGRSSASAWLSLRSTRKR